MFVKVNVIYQNYVIPAIAYTRRMNQGTDGTGKVNARPGLHIVSLVCRTSKATEEFFANIVNQTMIEFKIVFEPITGNGKSLTLILRDTYCIQYSQHFDIFQGLITYFDFSSAIVDFEGVIHYEHWKVSDIVPPKMVEPTPVPIEDPKLIRHYITDLKGNEIEEYHTGDKILLNIKTKNADGKNISVDLNHKTHDFKYNGKALENDILKDYEISSNLEKVELEVIDQQQK